MSIRTDQLEDNEALVDADYIEVYQESSSGLRREKKAFLSVLETFFQDTLPSLISGNAADISTLETNTVKITGDQDLAGKKNFGDGGDNATLPIVRISRSTAGANTQAGLDIIIGSTGNAVLSPLDNVSTIADSQLYWDFVNSRWYCQSNFHIAGDLSVAGALSKGSGSFKIAHPLKPDTHQLVHSFVESPYADNRYTGMVKLKSGEATINIDKHFGMTAGTFTALNTTFRRHTANESGFTKVISKLEGNILTIEAEDKKCTDEIFWEVIGERHDQHMLDTSWTDENGRVIIEPERQEGGINEHIKTN